MITIHSDIDRIEAAAWHALEASETANWFQTREAYAFFAAVPEEMQPFCFAAEEAGRLVGVVQGYLTQASNRLKQWFTRRANIVGGPMLSDTISDAALEQLLLTARRQLSSQAIYIETRNFNDYSRWRPVFERCGFAYQPHLNFHVDTSSADFLLKMNSSRRRQIRKGLEHGAVLEEAQSEEEVRMFYLILKDLYAKKVKTPLFSEEFFLTFYRRKCGRFLLVKKGEKVIGGIMCPIFGSQTIYEWFVCGLDEHFHEQYPSVLATYSAMSFANQNGISRFDFMGAGTPDTAYGVRDFKARFGGTLVEQGRYLCLCKPLLFAIGKLGVRLIKKTT